MVDEIGGDADHRGGRIGKGRGRDEPGAETPDRDEEEREHARRLRRDRRGRLAKALFLLTLVVLFVIFIAQNLDETPTIDFLTFHFEVSVIWIFLAVAFLGGLGGYVLGRPSRRLRLHDRGERDGG